MGVPDFNPLLDTRTNGQCLPRIAHGEGRHPPLPIPHADVIGMYTRQSPHGRGSWAHATVTPNHDGKLSFIIELFGRPRQVDVAEWAISLPWTAY